MTRRADLPQTRAEFLASDGVLLVVREAPPAPPPAKASPRSSPATRIEGDEILLAVWDDGSASALNGHVDLGTGIQTALGADRGRGTRPGHALRARDARRHRARAQPGRDHRERVDPDPFAAAAPGRGAGARLAAGARGRAPRRGRRMRCRCATASCASPKNPTARSATPTSCAGQRTVLRLDPQAQPKDPADYRVVGTRQARVDIPGQARRRTRVRARHARARHAARPRGAPAVRGRGPRRLHRQHAGVGRRIVHRAHPRHPRGGRHPRLRRHRRRARGARRAGAARTARGVEALARHARPVRRGAGAARQPVDAAPAGRRRRCRRRHRRAAQPMPRTYVWPYQMHASIGPSCALADWQPATAAACSCVLGRLAEPARAARRPGEAHGRARRAGRRGPHGSRGLLRPQRRRRRGRRCGAARARRRRAGARAAHARAGARVGAQGRRAAHGDRRRPDGRRLGGRLRLRDLVSVQRRAHAGAAAHAHHRAGGAGLRDGRPHRAPAVQLRQPAREGQRHGADRARLVAARRVGAAELVRARVVHRRAGRRPRASTRCSSACAT
jgi:hypothetical protein